MRTTTDPAVAVLGTGAIGTAVAKTLLAAAHEVRVWNRSAERLADAVGAGATPHESPADAARGAQLVLVTLTDYAAVHAVLAALEPTSHDGAVAVLTTGTPQDAVTASERAGDLGYAYLDGGVQTSPEHVGSATATILLAGDRAAYERHRPVLDALGSSRFVGEAPDAAALWDLALFGVWYDAQLGLLRALDLVAEHGIDVRAFAETAGVQLDHAATAAVATADELVAGAFPRGPADLREHLPVLERLAALHAGRKLGDGGSGPVAARVRRLIDRGRGDEGLTALLRDLTPADG